MRRKFLRTSLSLVGCLVFASCTTDSGLSGTAEPNDVVAAKTKLTAGETIRALAVRSKASRQGARPTESMVRRFDSQGRVLSEFVLRGDKWVQRESSLNKSLT